MYKQWKDRRKRKKFERDNAITACGSPRSFYRKTPEEIRSIEESMKGAPRINGYWAQVDFNSGWKYDWL